MRTLYLAIVLAAGLVSLSASAEKATDRLDLSTADGGYATIAIADPRVSMTLLAPKPDTASFCGQCTQDSDCGSGHKCCGPSNCRECFRVVTCP